MEDDLFLKKMKGVKPFKKNDKKFLNTNKGFKKKVIKKNETKPQQRDNPPLVHRYSKSQFNLTFNEINKDLKKGKIKIDRRLDLHGYSLIDAYDLFKKEIKKTYEKNKRCILVITGKGSHLNKTKEDFNPKLFYGKIKKSIISWAEEDSLKKYILTYQTAGIAHGGEGAIFIYLRKKKF